MEPATHEITIQVPPDVAQAYHQASVADRQTLSDQFSTILRERFTSTETPQRDLQLAIHKLVAEAQHNGLTQAAVASILQDDPRVWTEVKTLMGGELDLKAIDPVRLKNALLSAIESHDPRYQAELRDALQETTPSVHAQRGIAANEFGEWLAKL
jgi:hypothetical protein